MDASWQDKRSLQVVNLEMTKTGMKIDPVVIGDDFQVTRIYTGLPTNITIDMAWFTVRETEVSPAALIQKIITPTESISGHIVMANTQLGYLEMFFDATRGETINANLGGYVYDIQVRTTLNKIYTMEKGTITFISGVTSAS
jgi:hypothetical protein